MAADHSHDFRAQEAQEVGLSAACPLMREQNLETRAMGAEPRGFFQLNQLKMLMQLSV